MHKKTPTGQDTTSGSPGSPLPDPAIGPEVPRHVPATVGLQLFRVARYGYLLDCYCAGDADVLVGLEVASLLYHRLRARPGFLYPHSGHGLPVMNHRKT